MARQLLVLLAAVFAISNVAAAPIDAKEWLESLRENSTELSTEDFLKQYGIDLTELNKMEAVNPADLLLRRPIQLLDFLEPHEGIEHPEMEVLQMEVAPLTNESQTEGSEKYEEAVRKLSGMAPNLRRVELKGGFFYFPSMQIPTDQLLLEQMEYAYEDMQSITRAFAGINVTDVNFDWTVWIQNGENVTISQETQSKIKEMFGGQNQLQVREVWPGFHRLDLTNNFPCKRPKSEEPFFVYKLQAFVKQTKIDCAELNCTLPIGRSSIHGRFPQLPLFGGLLSDALAFFEGMKNRMVGSVHQSSTFLSSMLGRVFKQKVPEQSKTMNDAIDRIVFSVPQPENGTLNMTVVLNMGAGLE
ncbi:hypothetical protein M3Y99_00288400 [Aphelenchoides fujianensis]|nr:hypothetical protein M3Y99_00288400 [Aphelenchoides fujianensis]